MPRLNRRQVNWAHAEQLGESRQTESANCLQPATIPKRQSLREAALAFVQTIDTVCGGESLRRHVQAFLESLGSDAPVLVSCLNQPASFPLIESLSDSPTAQRLLLLADAAHVVHPMAGQGLNLGIGDRSVRSYR
ncbi:MAG: hypothetical protein EBW05_07080, partial [Betaproteobacteria bacterium]|nr:hypothetical protein [Betaproteobacteria bacterium]